MKLRKPAKSAAVHNGAWAAVRQDFEALEPVDQQKLVKANKALLAPLNLRPYLSRVAKAKGIEYVTVAVSGDEMLVIRLV